MDDAWKQLPRAAAIVYVGVLAAGTGRAAPAEQEPAEQEPAADSYDTTGESEPDPYEPDPVAPTCGPECHDAGWTPPQLEPPPMAPEQSKKGCAVESVEDERGLAVLGLGLLAGAIVRRRRGDESR